MCIRDSYKTVVVSPPYYSRVKVINQYLLIPCFSSLDYVTDLFSEIINGFLRWFNKKFTTVLSEIPSKKIKAAINMGYQRFLIRQFQTSIFQETFYQFFRFLSYFLSFGSNNEVISISRKINFIFCSMITIHFTALASMVIICKHFLDPI